MSSSFIVARPITFQNEFDISRAVSILLAASFWQSSTTSSLEDPGGMVSLTVLLDTPHPPTAKFGINGFAGAFG
jgi:hypothetical protein